MTTDFRLEQLDPLDYQRQTRKASIIIIVIFAASAMLLSSLLAMSFGSSEASNFKWNLTGVLLGLFFTIILISSHLRHQSWMQASNYGWRLKRNLMKVTNIMHNVKAGVANNDPVAIKTLRFYHLGLLQMQRLDGNPDQDMELIKEINQLQEKMQELDIELQQEQLSSQWLEQLKSSDK